MGNSMFFCIKEPKYKSLLKLEGEKGKIFFLSLPKHKQMAIYPLMSNPEKNRHLCFTFEGMSLLESNIPV
jgi:hypothetical protein